MTARQRTRAPSMVDVAREAGVGLGTVSRVLNDPAAVRAETQAKVLAAIEQLGYRRNHLARALKSGRSTTLGVVIAGSGIFELSRILEGVEAGAQEAEYWISLASWVDGRPERLAEIVDRLADQAVEGVAVVANRELDADVVQQLAARLPVTVVRSGDLMLPAVSTLEIDQRAGARLATRHLTDLGHRDVVHVTGRMDAFDSRARLEGFRSAMAEVGVAQPRHVEGDFLPSGGYAAGRALLASGHVPTAVFAGNDHMAIGLVKAFVEAGLRVPHDVSVVGFDDVPGTDHLLPPLTTVRQDLMTLGRATVELLAALVAGNEPQVRLIEPELVVRESTAVPRA